MGTSFTNDHGKAGMPCVYELGGGQFAEVGAIRTNQGDMLVAPQKSRLMFVPTQRLWHLNKPKVTFDVTQPGIGTTLHVVERDVPTETLERFHDELNAFGVRLKTHSALAAERQRIRSMLMNDSYLRILYGNMTDMARMQREALCAYFTSVEMLAKG